MDNTMIIDEFCYRNYRYNRLTHPETSPEKYEPVYHNWQELEKRFQKEHQCQHCGITSPNVRPFQQWVGGQGMTQGAYCSDLLACWKRWDEQHGIIGFNLEGKVEVR